MNVGSFHILTVFGIFWQWPYETTQCHTVLLQWFWGMSFCIAVKLTHTHIDRNIWEHRFFFLKLIKRRQKVMMDLHQEGVKFWGTSHVLAHSLVGVSLLSILDTLRAAQSSLLMRVLRGPGQEVGLCKCVLSMCLYPPLSTPFSVLAPVLGPRIGFLCFSPLCLWQLRKISFLLFQILNFLFALGFSFFVGPGSSCDTPRNCS